jgi:hypothetical protein
MYKSNQGRACIITGEYERKQGILHRCDVMPENPPDDVRKRTPVPSDPSTGFRSELPVNITLEDLIDLTGEMEHLNELIVLHLDRDGGFTCTEAYFATVQPILDLLEVEIRVRYQPGMSKNEMKLVIQDWIDQEIRTLQ